MRGYFCFLFSALGVICFCLLMFMSTNLSFFWLFLELATLCLIPGFFIYEDSSLLSGLFNYIVVSSISSSLILCGILYENLIFMLLVGLIIKFGLFPFWGWVYQVGLNSNWFVLWGLSTFLKAPIFFLPFFLSGGGWSIISFLCCLTFLGLSFLFWVNSYSWYHCWCHMMLSSSCSLVAMSFIIPMDVLLYLFLVYCLWSTLVILFFSRSGSSEDMLLGGVGYYFWFCFLLVSIPVSFSLFYKLIISVAMFSCGSLVIFCWVVYSISEQFYLLKYVMGCSLPKSNLGVFSVL